MNQPAALHPGRGRRPGRALLRLFPAMALVVSACSSSSKVEDEARQSDLEPVAADDGALALVPGGVQQLWVLDRVIAVDLDGTERDRSEEHTSELQSLMRISYAVFCLKKTTTAQKH